MTMNRETVRAWIEDATGEPLSVADALPDTIAATAEALGVEPPELLVWIHDHAQGSAEWTAASLVEWARRHHLDRNLVP